MEGMKPLNIDESQVKKLWYALFGICHALEHLKLTDHVNQLKDEETGLGAHMFARAVLEGSVIREEE